MTPTIIGYNINEPNCDGCYYPLLTKTISVFGKGVGCGAPLAYPPYKCCLPNDSTLFGACADALSSQSWDAISMGGSSLVQVIQGLWGGGSGIDCTNPTTTGPLQLSPNGGLVVGAYQINNSCACSGPNYSGTPAYYAIWKTRVYGPFPKFCVQFAVSGFGNDITIQGPSSLNNPTYIYQSYGPISEGNFIEIDAPQTPSWTSNLYGANTVIIGDCPDDSP